MKYCHINTDVTGTTRLTLDRPSKHNAFDDLLIGELQTALDALSEENNTRALVLMAKGKHFSAGADLDWMKKTAAYSIEQNERDAEAMASMLRTLNEFPAPTIARVQGVAFGGGVGLVACCDMVVAASDALFSLSEVKLGLIPATISPYVLDAIGVRAARRYFLTAEKFSAAVALELQLVTEVVEENQLDTQIEQLIGELLNNGPQAIQKTKKLIRDVPQMNVSTRSVETAKLIAAARASEEGQEGVNSFLEKRKPGWRAVNA